MSEHNLMAQITLPPTKYGEEDCKIWGSINNHSNFRYLKTVKEILSDSLFSRLKTTFLGPIIKAGLRKAGGHPNGDGLGFSGQLVHFLVVRQILSSREDEIWFCINNKPMRFSLTEFHLVTGLPCWIKEDEVPIDFECDWPLLLPDKRYRVDDLIAQLKVLGEDDEESKLRLAMLIVVLTIFMLPYGITKYRIPKEFLAMAKKNIYAHPWGKLSFDMLVSSVKSFTTKNLQQIDLKGFPMALQLWMLASVSELEEAYARLDNKSDRFPVCARYLSTVQPFYDQIMRKEEDLNVISVLGDSSEEEDDEVLMHLLKTGYVFSELDWKRGYALAQHQEDQEVEIGDRDSADVDETTPNTEADAHTEGDAVVHVVPLQLEDLEEAIQTMDLQDSPQNAPVAHGASSSSLAIQPSEVVPVAHGASASSLTIQPSEGVPLRTMYGRVVIPPSRLEQSGKKPIKKKNNRKK